MLPAMSSTLNRTAHASFMRAVSHGSKKQTLLAEQFISFLALDNRAIQCAAIFALSVGTLSYGVDY
jgi:hypothetical protein